MAKKLFILAGNGPYENRGCEAIIRGTVEIIRRYYEDPEFIVCSHFLSESHLAAQRKAEYDERVKHVKVNFLPVSKNKYINRLFITMYRFFPTKRREYRYGNLLSSINSAEAVLSIGGDNYSLDYGIPQIFTDLDDFVESRGKKLIIFGASVGPFRKNPKYEKYMSAHLQRQSAIFARESVTIDYLKSIQVEKNVYRVVDPAFVMQPQEPSDSSLYKDLDKTIGINLSPMMARYTDGGDEQKWLKRAVEIVKGVHNTFRLPILLVPHVFEDNSNDYEFMNRLREILNVRSLNILTPQYRAAELKWFMSKVLVFMGARTHSTIAAFSSCTPTITLAYSIKAEGLTSDIYGDLTYCIKPDEINPQKVCTVLSNMLENEKPTRTMLRQKIGKLIEGAYESGKILKGLCNG
ncbi:MAG: polysaccharide pyruvyl transferase family protein [bacterium]